MKSSALILLVALGMASSAEAKKCAHPDAHPRDKCKNGARFHICAATIPDPAQLFNPANTSDNDYDTPDCDPGKTVDPWDIALFNKVYEMLTTTTGSERKDVSDKFCRKLKNYTWRAPMPMAFGNIQTEATGACSLWFPPKLPTKKIWPSKRI
jgi:hypothetical protein